MKSFDTFLSEAVISRAVEKAKRMGFVSDGHGNWYDRQGQYRGRTAGKAVKEAYLYAASLSDKSSVYYKLM